MIKDNDFWSPTPDWVFYSTNNIPERLSIHDPLLTSVGDKYWLCFYTSIIFLEGNEVGPRSSVEISLAAFILLSDLIVSGNIFGEVSILVQMSNRKSQEFED